MLILADDGSKMEPIELYIDPGTATPEEIAELLIAISDLYRAFGGQGLEFKTCGGSAMVAHLPSKQGISVQIGVTILTGRRVNLRQQTLRLIGHCGGSCVGTGGRLLTA